MKNIRIIDNLKKRLFNNLDLFLVPIFVILSIIFILLPPYNQTYLRIIFALPLLLFMPGYMLIAVIFPKSGEIRQIERFTSSIGLSIAITVFDGFGLNYTNWGFRPNSITVSLSIIIGILLLIVFIQRWRYGEESYSFSFEDISSFYYSLKTKETGTGLDHDPAIEKMLIKTMIIAILIVTAMLVYAKVTADPEKFTVLYILGANGKAENYPAEVSVGEPSNILVGVENYEHAPVNYALLVTFGGINLTREDIYLDHEEKWVNNITFIPQLSSSIAFAGENRSKLEIQLLKENNPYRSVRLLVNTSLEMVTFGELPELINGDMESNESWMFSGSSPNISGSYMNNNSSSVYEINLTEGKAGSFGGIYQNITTKGTARTILSFDIRDSEYSNISYYVFKQALLDGDVIWEKGVGGTNSSWEHVEIPLLLSGNNTLAFRIYNKFNTFNNSTVWFDNIDLKPYGPVIKKIKRPVRKMYEFNFDIRGEPHQLEKYIRIDGFSFPGFKYNIDENQSYEELSLNLSDIDQTNVSIREGNATYITRVYGSELSLMGERFRTLGKDTPTNLTRIIDIPATMKIKLGETWKFGGVYSLSVSMISSKGDSAMLSLQKGASILDSRVVKRDGIFQYRKKAGKLQIIVFEAKIESITEDTVNLAELELYSDEILEVKMNDTLGDFEVTNISSDEIVLKNSYPIELKDKTVTLNGSVGFGLSGNMLYPYTSKVQLRGTPQYIYSGKWMNITGFNYPGFYLGNNTSYEELHMYFSANGFVEAGQAVYKTRVHSGNLSFLGNSYELINVNRPGYISNISNSTTIKLYENETFVLDGYNFSFNNISSEGIQLNIRKSSAKNKKDLMGRAIASNLTFFPDANYWMLTGNNNNLRKSNTLNIGNSFEYWEEFDIDRNHKKIAGELENINNNSIELKVRIYEIPFEIFQGKTYGEFEVYNIDNNSITLRNINPLRFEFGKETSILGGAMKIRTSSGEFIAFPLE